MILSICDAHLQLIKEMYEQKEILAKQHCMVEKEIVDLHHYIEMFCESEYQLLKASELLKDSLIRRREIKEDLLLIGRFLDVAPKNVKHKTFHSRNKAKYKPRILKKLFEEI